MNNIPYHTFPGLALPFLQHGIFTRQGGVSPAPFDSLNVGLTVGDPLPHVGENRRRIKQALGFEKMVAARQVHGTKVSVVEKPPAADLEIDGCDVLLTDVAGIGLMIQQADCQAILLADPVRRAIAAVHCGWRGSAANIVEAAVLTMRQAFGSRPVDLLAAISPALGPCCAEFRHYRSELPPALHAYQSKPGYFDFWAISRAQLQALGLQPDRIEIAGRCTVCHGEFFSYRRDKITGRHASVIGIRA